MAARPPLHHDGGLSLALAVVAASSAPLLLLDGDLNVIAASTSFSHAFKIESVGVADRSIFGLGAGEWNLPRLRSLLTATVSGQAQVEAYEMDLASDHGVRRLVLNAHRLDYDDKDQVRLLLTVADVTDARHNDKLKDDLLREKAILLQEVQHRVANSLQIIASVLLQSARKVQSAETRSHLADAHDRVMSIASVQQQLAASRLGEVALKAYLTQLCQSLGASMIVDHDKVSVAVSVDDSAVNADVSISLGLIVTELVINALKHAFPGGRDGKITVDYRAKAGDWTLAIGDDGVGMPKDALAKPGLGTSIVEALANQLQAEVRVTDGHPGTMVSIVHTFAPGHAQAPAEPAAEAV
ncbi:MAG: histidine kinase [Caulobacter sp.]|nr:histidine kinase [Caulobacter sp.]